MTNAKAKTKAEPSTKHLNAKTSAGTKTNGGYFPYCQERHRCGGRSVQFVRVLSFLKSESNHFMSFM